MSERFSRQRGAGPAIETRAHLCLRARFARSRCAHCREVCPAGAVSLDEDTVSLLENCSGCEACLAACPAGVFKTPDLREASRRSRLRELVEADPDLIVSCEVAMPGGGDSALVLPCLAALAKEYLIAAFAWGAQHIEIRRGPCEKCAQAGAMLQYERSLQQARTLLACFDRATDAIQEVPFCRFGAGAASMPEPPTAKGLGRREFFGYFRERAAQAAAKARSERSTQSAAPRWIHGEDPLRAFLLEVLPALGASSRAQVPRQGFPVADLRVSPACIGCNVCETLCPTGAIRRDEQSENALSLMFTPARCTACGICAEACLPKAMTLLPSLDVQELLSGAEKLLIQVRAKACRICGLPFLGLPGDLCPRCLGVGKGRGRRV